MVAVLLVRYASGQVSRTYLLALSVLYLSPADVVE